MKVLANAGTNVIPGVLKGINSLDPSTLVQHTVAVPFSDWSQGKSPIPFSLISYTDIQTRCSRQLGEVPYDML